MLKIMKPFSYAFIITTKYNSVSLFVMRILMSYSNLKMIHMNMDRMCDNWVRIQKIPLL